MENTAYDEEPRAKRLVDMKGSKEIWLSSKHQLHLLSGDININKEWSSVTL